MKKTIFSVIALSLSQFAYCQTITDNNSKIGIGIGYVEPNELLDVEGDAEFGDGTGLLKIKQGDLSYDGNERTFLFHNRATNRKIGLGIVDNGSIQNYIELFEGNSIASQYIDFGIKGNSAMKINSDGYTGIGTTTPNELLDVEGDAEFGDDIGLLKIKQGDLSYDGNERTFLFHNRATNRKIGLGIVDNGSIQNYIELFEGNSVASQYIDFGIKGNSAMKINSDGKIGIGTITPDSDALLTVKGAIHSTEIKVLANAGVPDYVFEEDYELRTLSETKKFIQENKHLPEIPSAAEISANGGFDVGDMNMKLLKKIEELTLHLIEQNERIEKLEQNSK